MILYKKDVDALICGHHSHRSSSASNKCSCTSSNANNSTTNSNSKTPTKTNTETRNNKTTTETSSKSPPTTPTTRENKAKEKPQACSAASKRGSKRNLRLAARIDVLANMDKPVAPPQATPQVYVWNCVLRVVPSLTPFAPPCNCRYVPVLCRAFMCRSAPQYGENAS